jgi:transposase
MIHQEEWMDLQAFAPLLAAGMTWKEIGDRAGCDWRTAKKYLSTPEPPSYGPRPLRPRVIDAYADLVDATLRTEPFIRAVTVFERLAAEPYRFPGSYQRVKEYVARRRPEILAELALRDPSWEMFRRFEVAPGSQAQVDWGHEEPLDTPEGLLPVYSFHLVLSCSRDPFCRYTASQDLATFWGAHTEAFSHFGGVPATIVYDRTKTVVRRHVGRGEHAPLHPEAVAFAAHYGFAIRLCWPKRPQTKGRVENSVKVAREHVLSGRTFSSIEEMQRAWDEWLPRRRSQVHRTHGEVIAVRAERDRAALRPLPERPYVVSERHIRVVGKDALVSFGASVYSVPWTKVRPRQRVELRVSGEEVAIYTVGASPQRLATHPRARRRGSWMVDERHWDGLPDGTKPGQGPAAAPSPPEGPDQSDLVADTLARLANAAAPVARRSPKTYDRLFGVSAGRRVDPDIQPAPESGPVGLLWPSSEEGSR